MAEVPLSVSRSISTSSAGIRNGLKWAARRMSARSAGVVMRTGSTILIRNGSMIVFTATLQATRGAEPYQVCSRNHRR